MLLQGDAHCLINCFPKQWTVLIIHRQRPCLLFVLWPTSTSDLKTLRQCRAAVMRLQTTQPAKQWHTVTLCGWAVFYLSTVIFSSKVLSLRGLLQMEIQRGDSWSYQSKVWQSEGDKDQKSEWKKTKKILVISVWTKKWWFVVGTLLLQSPAQHYEYMGYY